MIENTLKEIGLTTGEISVYLALLELGSTKIGPLIKKSKVSGSKAYEVLERLSQKGLAGRTIINNTMYFEAASPEKIIEYLNEKENLIKAEKNKVKKIIPELILKCNKQSYSKAKIFTGFEGMKTVNQYIIDSLSKGDEWLSMGLTEQPKTWEIYFNKKQKERAKKGINHKQLLNQKYQSLYRERKGHTQIKFLPAELDMPTSTEIFGDNIAIFILIKEDPLVLLIQSEAVAKSFRKYFYMIWSSIDE